MGSLYIYTLEQNYSDKQYIKHGIYKAWYGITENINNNKPDLVFTLTAVSGTFKVKGLPLLGIIVLELLD
jgi:hypothetical protein